MVVDRRTLLARAAAAGALLALEPVAFAHAAKTRTAAFAHGVASGDPLPTGVILWTRVTPDDPGGAPLRVRWWIAEAARPGTPVRSGTVRTGADRDWTVKVDARGLRPGRRYVYGFRAGDADSPVGSTRTAPLGGLEPVLVAAVSCSSYAAGHFNAYGTLAEQRDDLDLIVHLGDYIYESGGSGVRVPSPRREIVSLDDYRERYAQHRADPQLQAAHAAAPWATVWDDHESANDAWRDGAQAHQPATEGPWADRRSRAVRAYAEWMPIRFPDRRDPLRIWRRLRFGDLIDLFLVDTRLHGRNAPGTDTSVTGTESDDPSRTMLGPQQKAWLFDGLRRSEAVWRVLGNQTMISPHRSTPLPQELVGLPYLPDEVRELTGTRQGGANEGGDNWGAYRVERDELIGALRGRGDNVVLTGDIHTAWGCDVVEDPNSPLAYDRLTGRGSAGVELVCASVTSNNIGETAGQQAARALGTAVVAGNPNVQHCDLGGHGYTLARVGPGEVRAEWREVDTVLEPSRTESTTARLACARETNHLAPLG